MRKEAGKFAIARKMLDNSRKNCKRKKVEKIVGKIAGKIAEKSQEKKSRKNCNCKKNYWIIRGKIAREKK